MTIAEVHALLKKYGWENLGKQGYIETFGHSKKPGNYIILRYSGAEDEIVSFRHAGKWKAGRKSGYSTKGNGEIEQLPTYLASLQEAIIIPVEKGDTILGGRFKNKKIKVKSIGHDEHDMPTINGRKVVTFRTVKESSMRITRETIRAIIEAELGDKLTRLGGRYGGEPEKAIANPGNKTVKNPVTEDVTHTPSHVVAGHIVQNLRSFRDVGRYIENEMSPEMVRTAVEQHDADTIHIMIDTLAAIRFKLEKAATTEESRRLLKSMEALQQILQYNWQRAKK